MATRYKLKLSKLTFASIVDGPAQETAKLLLIKRSATGDEFTATAKFVKANDELGLAWFWAFQGTTADGAVYHDLQGDAIVADDTMIKACAEFMENGGAVDENHDGIDGAGKIIFGMPMNAEVAKTYGLGDVKASGFMLVVKPSADVLAKLKSGELNGISIAGSGERTPLEKKVMLTTSAVGHTHMVDDLDGAGSGYTSCELMGRADTATYHSHPWARDAAGAIVIGMSAGHSHDVLQPANAEEAATETVIAARAPQGNRPTQGTAAKVNNMKPVVLTEAQHAHYSKLVGEDAEAFIAKSHSDRDAIVKAALDADPIVFKGEVTGTEVRKSDGPLTKKLAEQNESNAKALAKAQTDMAAEIEKRQVEVYKARAMAEIGHLAGDDAAKVNLLKRIDAEPDATAREGMLALVKGADAFAKEAGKPRGFNPEAGVDNTAEAQLRKAVEEIAKRDGTPYEVAFVKATASDPKVRELYDATNTVKTARN